MRQSKDNMSEAQSQATTESHSRRKFSLRGSFSRKKKANSDELDKDVAETREASSTTPLSNVSPASASTGKNAREARRKKIEEYNARKSGMKETVKELPPRPPSSSAKPDLRADLVEKKPPPPEESAPPASAARGAVVEPARTEEHEGKMPSSDHYYDEQQPVVESKRTSSSSQKRKSERAMSAKQMAAAEAAAMQTVLSDESKPVETILPPRLASAKKAIQQQLDQQQEDAPADIETMVSEDETATVDATEKRDMPEYVSTGYLCGCF